MNYYNEFDPKAAEWLRQLIKQGLIPNGDVDERSIADVRADELRGYTQCHFFAGIGGWSLALQQAGWPSDRPAWTGSCPCQPFSTAGKRKGFADERDLWPVFFELIKKAKPKVVFGEQVASSEVVGSSVESAFVNAVRTGDFARANKLAHQLSRSPNLHYYSRWVDRVYTDMETAGYTMRTEVLGAHSVGAPHQRQRLYWGGALLECMADSERTERRPKLPVDVYDRDNAGRNKAPSRIGACGKSVSVADGNSERLDREQVSKMPKGNDCTKITRSGGVISLANSNISSRNGLRESSGIQSKQLESKLSSISNLPWQQSVRVLCCDGKVRRIPAESIFFGLVDGLPGELDGSRLVGLSDVGGFPLTTQKEGRPMLLKGYGNAIVPQVAAEFVTAFNQSIYEMSNEL